MIEKRTVKSVHTRLKRQKSPNWFYNTVEGLISMPVFLPPPQLKQGSTGSFKELATGIISIKTNKEQSQKRSGAVLYCTSSSSKECSLLQPYIAVANNQKHSNEELVVYIGL
jgi:hypothetical protein